MTKRYLVCGRVVSDYNSNLLDHFVNADSTKKAAQAFAVTARVLYGNNATVRVLSVKRSD